MIAWRSRLPLRVRQSLCQKGEPSLASSGHDATMATQTRRLDEMTTLVAHLGLDSEDCDAEQVCGELTLSAKNGASWRGRLSMTALDEAERVRRNRGATPGDLVEASLILRVAVDYDLGSYGVACDWEQALVEVSDGLVTVKAPVRPLPQPGIGRSAHVVVELVDMLPNYATWQVEDEKGQVADERELPATDLEAHDLDSLVERVREAWQSFASSAGVRATEGLSLRLSVTTLDAGSCGELRVFARVR